MTIVTTPRHNIRIRFDTHLLACCCCCCSLVLRRIIPRIPVRKFDVYIHYAPRDIIQICTAPQSISMGSSMKGVTP